MVHAAIVCVTAVLLLCRHRLCAQKASDDPARQAQSVIVRMINKIAKRSLQYRRSVPLLVGYMQTPNNILIEMSLCIEFNLPISLPYIKNMVAESVKPGHTQRLYLKC